MAVVIAFGRINRGCLDASARTEVIANPTSSTATTAEANDQDGVIVTAIDATWVAFGPSPTAAVDTDGSHFVPAGGRLDLTGMRRGWKVAAINDS